MPYQPVKLNLTKAQQAKALRGAPIRISKDAILNGSQIVMMHPLNAKKVTKSANGINITFSPGELIATGSYHGMIPKMDMSNVDGSGFFDTVWEGLKGVGKFLKDTGIASTLADVAQGVAGPIIGENLSRGLREGLRGATGVGIKKKGRPSKAGGLYLGKGNGAKMTAGGLYL